VVADVCIFVVQKVHLQCPPICLLFGCRIRLRLDCLLLASKHRETTFLLDVRIIRGTTGSLHVWYFLGILHLTGVNRKQILAPTLLPLVERTRLECRDTCQFARKVESGGDLFEIEFRSIAFSITHHSVPNSSPYSCFSQIPSFFSIAPLTSHWGYIPWKVHRYCESTTKSEFQKRRKKC
jgi:hypothetical protein